MKSTVYFSNNINSLELVKLFKHLGVKLQGKVCVKLHSGEPGNQNFLGPDYFKEIIEHVNGVVVEANTAYDGERNENAELFAFSFLYFCYSKK